MQAGILRSRYPNARLHLSRIRLTAVIELTPTAVTDTYEVLFDHRLEERPLVYVPRPRLQVVPGQGLPHVYGHNTLCLYHGLRQWNGSRPLVDLVGWATEWLFYYELWLATGGQWFGGGIHPSPGPPTPRRARRLRPTGLRRRPQAETVTAAIPEPSDADTLERLTDALRLMYPRSHPLDQLLGNARLPD